MIVFLLNQYIDTLLQVPCLAARLKCEQYSTYGYFAFRKEKVST